MKFNCKEDIIQITPLWKGERMEDGRPKVSADVLAPSAQDHPGGGLGPPVDQGL